jgi:NADP-dependent 3-hydroxy acid dehydrogenase YdfG
MKVKAEHRKLSVNEIELLTHIDNMLNNAGIATLGDLENYDLTKYRNIKTRHLDQLKQ